jgi:NifU-like protein involved in Fe-S cluster formation
MLPDLRPAPAIEPAPLPPRTPEVDRFAGYVASAWSTSAAESAPVAQRRAPLYRRGVTTALYSRDILRLAASIPHLGRLEAAQAEAEKRSATCGSTVAVGVRLDAEGRVDALAQDVKACALGQASASLMGAHALGRSPEEIADARDSLALYLKGERDDPGDWPGLAVFAPARPHAARHASILLAFDAAAEAAAKAARS